MKTLVGLGLLLFAACGPTPDHPDGGSCPNDQPAACVQPSPTYDGGISAIISARCFPCHAGDESASGIPLDSYAAINQVGSIQLLAQILSCRMPLADAGQPTADERAELLHWLTCGAPE